MSTEVEDTKLVQMIMKLLNKAGKDPRVTPRILRSKAEERLQLPKDALKPKREYIKKLIARWWKDQQAASGNATGNTTTGGAEGGKVGGNGADAIKEKLIKMCKSIGLSSIVQSMPSDKSAQECISYIRSKLGEVGIKLSDSPTDKEISDARKDYELKKEAQDLASDAIMTPGKKRSASGVRSEGESVEPDVKKAASESST